MQADSMKSGQASAPVELDGRMGEGGGQVLRSALTLSLCSGRPVQIQHIRAGRRRPGLMRQHLACVRAALAVSGGGAQGAELGSSELLFQPGPVRCGDYRFEVGSAGSAALVLQTVLLPLLLAEEASQVRVVGGTHNAWAPPYEFLQHSFLPQLARMGAAVELVLERIGFYPAGGGILCAKIPALQSAESTTQPLQLLDRGAALDSQALIQGAHLPARVYDREWEAMSRILGWEESQRCDQAHKNSLGPGNCIHAILRFAEVTEVVTSFGARNRSSNQVGADVAHQAQQFLQSKAAVGRRLADQLLLPMALLQGGEFHTTQPSQHTLTNAEVIHAFHPGLVQMLEVETDLWKISVQPSRTTILK